MGLEMPQALRRATELAEQGQILPPGDTKSHKEHRNPAAFGDLQPLFENTSAILITLTNVVLLLRGLAEKLCETFLILFFFSKRAHVSIGGSRARVLPFL